MDTEAQTTERDRASQPSVHEGEEERSRFAFVPWAASWLPGGRLFFADNDGRLLRWIDPGAGSVRELGVIYDPGGDLVYSARRGEGAFRNKAPIRVSDTAELARATVDIGYSHRTAIDDFAGIMTRLLAQGVNVTQSGSAALGLARVADGRLDGYAERHLYAWDALAGLLLVEEAGGRVNTFLEGDALTAGNVTIAATPALYAAIAGVLDVR